MDLRSRRRFRALRGFRLEEPPWPEDRDPEAGSLNYGLGFGVWGVGFRVWGVGFRVWGLGFRVWGLGFGVLGLGFRES